jgi:hypothetical protein
MGPVLGSSVYALAITLVYGTDAAHSHHHSSYFPIDGRVVFLLSGAFCYVLSCFAKSRIKSVK